MTSETHDDDLESLKLKLEIKRLKCQVRHLQATLQRVDSSLLSSAQIHMYTGLCKLEFDCLACWLSTTSLVTRSVSPLDPDEHSVLSHSQKLLIVLIRMRHNISQADLACRFCVDQSSISRIINQWIPMMAVVLSGLIMWPQTTIGPKHPPYNFLPNSVAIIDGTGDVYTTSQ